MSIGGGSIIRDGSGKLIVAFLEKLVPRTNNSVKLQPLLSGIYFYVESWVQRTNIWSDSSLIASWLKAKSWTMWYLWNFGEELEEELCHLQCTFKHIFREGNQFADFLAWQCEGGLTKRYMAGDELLVKLRGLIRLDKLNIPCPIFIVSICLACFVSSRIFFFHLIYICNGCSCVYVLVFRLV